ncbi:MAG: META domain-containing protein [Chloroflexi bacterium]|nr:META domain-containing protein [Chloroflexota bacterium]
MRFSNLSFIAILLVSFTITPTVMGQTDGSNLVGTRWQLVSFGTPGSETTVTPGTITLEFMNETEMGGSGGCNSYGGSYVVDGDVIMFSQIASTLIACLDTDVAEREQAYFSALEFAERFAVADNTLTIWTVGGQQLNFEQMSSLVGTRWQLQSYGTPDDETPVVAGSNVTLEFQQGGQFVGSGGCNSYGATYTVTDDIISVGEVVSTKMACAGAAIMEQEQGFFNALQAAQRFELSDDQLTIWFDEEARLIFAPVSELIGSAWQLQSFALPDEEVRVIAGSNVTLEFQPGNQAVGSGGCNSYGGTYTISGDMLSFGEIVSTERACVDAAIMEQEQRFYDALQSAVRYEVTGGQLTIWYAEESRLIFNQSGVVSSPPSPPITEDSSPGSAPSSSSGSASAELFDNPDSPVGLLASYYNAINRGEYERAYAYWESAPNPFDEFVSGFADTASVQVIVEPPTRYEGAAGSLYVAIPTVLIALHHDGNQLMFAGCFVARKSNLSPPDEEPVWHLYSADIVQVPNDSDIPSLLAGACSAG